MAELLIIVPAQYTKVDTDALYEQTGVTASQLAQAMDDNFFSDINDSLRAGGFITEEQTVMESLVTPNNDYYLRIE